MASAPTPADVEVARAAAARPLDHALTTDPGLARRLATADWSAGVVEEGGQFHRVLVLPRVGAVRMTRTPEAADLLPSRVCLVRALATTAELPFAVPIPLTEVVGLPGGTAAVVQEYLPGEAHPAHLGDPAVLREVCRTLRGIDTTPLRAHLGSPFAYHGPWTLEKVAAVQELPERLTDTYGEGLWPGDDSPTVAAEGFARTVRTLTDTVIRWTEHPVVPPSLVHGDLAGHNLRWTPAPAAGPGGGAPTMAGETGWQLTGILDWDLACLWDPALNPAYLCLWHGENLLDAVAEDPFEAQRARVWLGAMSLEALFDASLREGQEGDAHPANWPKLLRKVLPRIDRAASAQRTASVQ